MLYGLPRVSIQEYEDKIKEFNVSDIDADDKQI
jgi:hypothetical protein